MMVMCQIRRARNDGWCAASLFTLDRAFRYQKAASKSLYQARISDLNQEINQLRRFDPAPLSKIKDHPDLEMPDGFDTRFPG
jgi:hypothetical protein